MLLSKATYNKNNCLKKVKQYRCLYNNDVHRTKCKALTITRLIQKCVGYDIKSFFRPDPPGPLSASLLNQMNQLLELLALVEHERVFIRGLFIIVSNVS